MCILGIRYNELLLYSQDVRGRLQTEGADQCILWKTDPHQRDCSPICFLSFKSHILDSSGVWYSDVSVNLLNFGSWILSSVLPFSIIFPDITYTPAPWSRSSCNGHEWNMMDLSKLLNVFLPNWKLYLCKFLLASSFQLEELEAGAAIMDRVKYEPIMAPTSTTCRQTDQNPLQKNMQ